MVIVAINYWLLVSVAAESIEQRGHRLFYQLRCVVCQGQSLAESDSLIAEEIRKLIWHRLERGDSDREIIGFLRTRYGQEMTGWVLEQQITENTLMQQLLRLLPLLTVLSIISAVVIWLYVNARLRQKGK